MLTILTISLREFLEAFLIIGVFLGINKKLNLKKEKKILLASTIGVIISIILPVLTFYFGDQAKKILNEQRIEIIEGYLLIFSGIFTTYVVFSLHQFIHQMTDKKLILAHSKMKDNVFDFTLFALIIFFIIREGFEIALFTFSLTLISDLIQNLIGLFIGFVISSFISLLAFFSFIKLSFNKIYKITEWLIILFGGSMIINGINEILEATFNLKWHSFLPVKLEFLPYSSSLLGNLLKNFFALQREYSLLIPLFMTVYIVLVKKFLLSRKLIKIQEKANR